MELSGWGNDTSLICRIVQSREIIKRYHWPEHTFLCPKIHVSSANEKPSLPKRPWNVCSLPHTHVWPVSRKWGGASLSDDEWRYIIFFHINLSGCWQADGLPHTFSASTRYIYFKWFGILCFLTGCIIYLFSSSFFFSSQNVKRGGALAPSMDAPPLLCLLIWMFHWRNNLSSTILNTSLALYREEPLWKHSSVWSLVIKKEYN